MVSRREGVYGSGNDVNRIQIAVTLCERIARPHVCQKLKTELLVDIYFEKFCDSMLIIGIPNINIFDGSFM